jgi:hypothetical protein
MSQLNAVSVIVAGDFLRALRAQIVSPESRVVYGEEMYEIARKMAGHSKLERELRELGRILHTILAGERKPILNKRSPQ